MKVVITDCPAWNGEYDLESLVFTQRELHQIKQISGVRGGELLEALIAEDAAAYVALAVVVLGRAGKRVTADEFWDTPRTSIRLVVEDDEDDPLPPTSEPDGSGESIAS